jgi:hypothetical protein
MQFDDDRVDTSHVEDRRDGTSGSASRAGGTGSDGGMGTAAQIGLMSLLMRSAWGRRILTMLMIGAAVMALFSMCSGDTGQQQSVDAAGQATGLVPAQGSSQDLATRCNQPGAIEEYADCLLTKAFNETDEVWSQEFARTGNAYRTPGLVFFDDRVSTACGPATTAVGPFYCPGDERIYFDLGFAGDLKRLGVDGDYANVYIMAHEFGHHLQNITGIEKQVRRLQARDRKNANQYGIDMELQADCFAGAWGKMANDRGNLTITRAELKQAMNAAAAVGDDRIQKQAGMRVNPDTWTHGSARQRESWYLVGFNTGDFSRCDTYASS